jgi:hypothetical protein
MLQVNRRRAFSNLPKYLAVFAAGVVCCFGQAQTGYSGRAYGTKVSVHPANSSVKSGTTALSQLCTENTGVSNTNSVANVTLPPLVSTGAIDTSVSSMDVTGGTASTAISNVAGISLLGTAITGDAIKSVSSSISASGGYSTSSEGTLFTNVVVLGNPIEANVAPNTRIVLPGIGFVILNEQMSKVTSTSAQLTVIGIHVHVTEDNSLHLPIGTQVIVAYADSRTMANVALLDGFAYGSAAAVNHVVQAGRSAEVVLNCSGSDEDETNNVAGENIPGVLATGAIHTRAQETVSSTSASAELTASVAGVNLLSGLVTATAVTSEANVTAGGANLVLNDTGSIFAGLAVNGHPEVGANPPPNTRVSIAGLGTLWLHRVIRKSTSIEVRMIELVVDTSNSFGLPVGTDVRISVAHAGAAAQ